MIQFTRYQKMILCDLYKAVDRLDAFTFCKRYGFEASYLLTITKKLIRMELIVLDDTIFSITEKGKKLVESQVINLEDGTLKPWLIIPDEFISNKIEPWEPYMPSIKRLGKFI